MRSPVGTEASSEVDEVKQVVHVRRLSGHLPVGLLKTDSRFTQRKGEPVVVVGGERDTGVGEVGGLWRIDNPEPGISTVGRAIGLDQGLH